MRPTLHFAHHLQSPPCCAHIASRCAFVLFVLHAAAAAHLLIARTPSATLCPEHGTLLFSLSFAVSVWNDVSVCVCLCACVSVCVCVALCSSFYAPLCLSVVVVHLTFFPSHPFPSLPIHNGSSSCTGTWAAMHSNVWRRPPRHHPTGCVEPSTLVVCLCVCVSCVCVCVSLLGLLLKWTCNHLSLFHCHTRAGRCRKF